jgi:hypothetical protein
MVKGMTTLYAEAWERTCSLFDWGSCPEQKRIVAVAEVVHHFLIGVLLKVLGASPVAGFTQLYGTLSFFAVRVTADHPHRIALHASSNMSNCTQLE